MIDALAKARPGLDRPLVDTIHGSTIANRPGTVRILFVFARWRSSVLAEQRHEIYLKRAPRRRAASHEQLRSPEGPSRRARRARRSVDAGKQELLATVVGHRLADMRRARGQTQQVADRMGVTKGRVSQIEHKSR